MNLFLFPWLVRQKGSRMVPQRESQKESRKELRKESRKELEKAPMKATQKGNPLLGSLFLFLFRIL